MNLQPREFFQDEYVISTNPARLDLAWTHDYLTNDAYWAQGISYRVFEKSTEHALCFGVYHQIAQVGFGRAISDFATFVYRLSMKRNEERFI